MELAGVWDVVELPHVFDGGTCWCEPRLELADPGDEDSARVWVHRDVAERRRG